MSHVSVVADANWLPGVTHWLYFSTVIIKSSSVTALFKHPLTEVIEWKACSWFYHIMVPESEERRKWQGTSSKYNFYLFIMVHLDCHFYFPFLFLERYRLSIYYQMLIKEHFQVSLMNLSQKSSVVHNHEEKSLCVWGVGLGKGLYSLLRQSKRQFRLE